MFSLISPPWARFPGARPHPHISSSSFFWLKGVLSTSFPGFKIQNDEAREGEGAGEEPGDGSVQKKAGPVVVVVGCGGRAFNWLE